MDDNSFANLVRTMNKMDSVPQAPVPSTPKAQQISEGLKQNDMMSILENMYKDQPFESAKSLDSGTTKQFQKGYMPKQLPADYKMPSVGPVLGSTKQLKNPTKGYLVGEDEETIDISDIIDGAEEIEMDSDGVDIDIKDYDKNEYDQEGANAKDHLARAADAALELQGILDDNENLPEWVQGKIIKALDYLDISRDYMKQELGEYSPHRGSEESWDGVNPTTAQTTATTNQGYEGPIAPEGEKDPTQLTKVTKEDTIGKKKSIMDYLSDVEKQRTEDMLSEPVKTFKTDDGKEMKIHGNEDDGYRVKVNGKESKKSFGKLADAVLACETFVQRTKDYAREK
tara:strand:- start:1378 stop:2400 length:1023 start_codon:yes stop_codon:yes gene_type:complete